jgi:hypothetical protein
VVVRLYLTDSVTGGDVAVAEAAPQSSAKRPAASPVDNSQVSAKKQAPSLLQTAVITPVVVQAIARDSTSRQKLSLVVAMPANIIELGQLTIEFADEAGLALTIQVPRGLANSNMDKVKTAFSHLVSDMDAAFMAQALETKMMECRRSKAELVYDTYHIDLEVACDINKLPMAALCRAKDDGDIACCIILDVPSINHYGAVAPRCNTCIDV